MLKPHFNIPTSRNLDPNSKVSGGKMILFFFIVSPVPILITASVEILIVQTSLNIAELGVSVSLSLPQRPLIP